MGITSLRQDSVMFAMDMPPQIDAVLQEAVVFHENEPKRAEQLLQQALDLAPGRLEVYVAFYKFYFYKNRISEAEAIALKALDAAAEQGGFSADWSCLSADAMQWHPATDAQRFFLYTMKALAFINLRKGNPMLADSMLTKLAELDPKDQVGASVIRDLASGVAE